MLGQLSKLTAIALIPGVLLSSGIVARQLLGTPALAQSNSGFVVTGADRQDVLYYKLDFGGKTRQRERYRLSVPAQDVAVSELQINFASNFDGKVNPDRVSLEVEDEEIEIDDVFWDPEFRSLEVVASEPIAAGQEMKLILSSVRNPRRPGFYRIQARTLGTEPNPIFRYVGLWVVGIEPHTSDRL